MEKRNNTIYLNESDLQQIIEESVQQILNEGFFDNLKAGVSGAVQGARRGFQGQKMLDRGTDNFKQTWDRDDLAAQANPYGPGAENTASMQANQAFRLYKEYQQEANKYLNLYNKLSKKYNLGKEKPGLTKSKEKEAFYGSGGIRRNKNKFGSKIVGRDRLEDVKPAGPWGK